MFEVGMVPDEPEINNSMVPASREIGNNLDKNESQRLIENMLIKIEVIFNLFIKF